MKKILLALSLLVTLSCIIYSCDSDESVQQEQNETEGELLLKDKFGINSVSNELINTSELIELPNETKSIEEKYIDVLNYEDGRKAYIIPRGEEKYTVVLYDVEQTLMGKKDFEIIYNEEGEVIDYTIKEHDATNVKFYRNEDESYVDCVDRAFEDVTDTLWGKIGAMIPGGAPTILAASAVSCI